MRPGLLAVFRLTALVGLLVAAAATAAPELAAAESVPRDRVVVDFAAADDQPAWLAEALEQRVLRELARFGRVEVVDPLAPGKCPRRDSDCVLEAYLGAGVDVVVLGTLRERKLSFEVLETWTQATAFSGSIRLSKGISSARLDHQVGDIVRPIIRSGGLLDQKPAVDRGDAGTPLSTTVQRAPARRGKKKRIEAPDAGVPTEPLVVAAPLPPAAPPPPPEPSFLVPILLLGLAAFVASPVLAAFSLLGRAIYRRRVRPRSWPATFVLTGTLAVASLFPVTTFTLTEGPYARVITYLLGGVLWGVFALLHVGMVIPALNGIGRVRHETLAPLLSAWTRVTLSRVLGLALLYAPLLYSVLFYCEEVRLSFRTTWLFVVPLMGMLCAFWLLSLVDNLSAYLDDQITIGEASARNPWHLATQRYLLGYVRRTGLDLSADFVKRCLCLPGKVEGTVCYGGGLTAPRIVVNAEILELALGPLRESNQVTEGGVNLEHLPLGLIFPDSNEEGAKRRAERAQRLRSLKAELPLPRGFTPRLIGENATLLGWVVPSPVDETVPLISNTKEDYEVVHSLLTEHYAAFESEGAEGEHDDTDPTQKDFLFGALLRELGAVRRGESLLTTLRLSALAQSEKLSWVGRWLVRWTFELYDRFASRPAAAMADGYVALNFARDHLVQYLHLLRSPQSAPSVFTARADAPLLFSVSRGILDGVEKETPSGLDRHFFRATARNRLVSLSHFFYAPIPERRERRFRLAVGTVGLLLVAAVVGSLVKASADYDPVYNDRLRQMRERVEQSQQGEADGGT